MHDKEKVLAGTQLAAGALDVEEVLKIRGLRAAQEYLLDSIQGVYESQNIGINDRHFEVIIRRMSDKVQIINAGDTKFIVGSFVDLLRFRKVNEKQRRERLNRREAVNFRLNRWRFIPTLAFGGFFSGNGQCFNAGVA